MSKNGLIYPRLRVVMEDGAEWEVQPKGKDQIRWEETAAKHKWANFQETPAKWQTFLGWRASVREGLLPSSVGSWETFLDLHDYVQPVDLTPDEDRADAEDEDGPGPADAPFTRPAAGTG
jgi:hypothetical protein